MITRYQFFSQMAKINLLVKRLIRLQYGDHAEFIFCQVPFAWNLLQENGEFHLLLLYHPKLIDFVCPKPIFELKVLEHNEDIMFYPSARLLSAFKWDAGLNLKDSTTVNLLRETAIMLPYSLEIEA